MSRAPYAPGDLVSVAYEPDSVAGPYRSRPALTLRSVVPVQRVVPMADGRFRVEFNNIPDRASVAYVVDGDGAAADAADMFGPLGVLAPDGHPWIFPVTEA
jgi:hypothetical protein